MSTDEALHFIKRVVDLELFKIAETPVTVSTVLTLLVVVALSYWISTALQRGIERLFRRRGIDDEGSLRVTRRLTHYLIMALGIGVGLQTVGVKLGALFAAGAVFAVGLGFAMQNIAENFVSGVILLIERTIKPGDVLDVDGTVVKVIRMGIRATLARTRDEEDLIIPNSKLVQSTVKNYTLADSLYRVRALVGVVYSSDLEKVRATLNGAAERVDGRVSDPAPRILLVEFGSSSVNYDVSVWISTPWLAPIVHSRLMESIWWAFKDSGIVIAFPQLDVHFDPPIVDSLSALRELRRAS